MTSDLGSVLHDACEAEILLCVCITASAVFDNRKFLERDHKRRAADLRAVDDRFGSDAGAHRTAGLTDLPDGYELIPSELLTKGSSFGSWLMEQEQYATTVEAAAALRILHSLTAYPRPLLVQRLTTRPSNHFLINFERVRDLLTFFRETLGLSVAVRERTSAGWWIPKARRRPVTDPHVVVSLKRQDGGPLTVGLLLEAVLETTCRLCQDAVGFRLRAQASEQWYSALFDPNPDPKPSKAPNLLDELAGRSKKRKPVRDLGATTWVGLGLSELEAMCFLNQEQTLLFSCWRHESLEHLLRVVLEPSLAGEIQGLGVELREGTHSPDAYITATIPRYPRPSSPGNNSTAKGFAIRTLRTLRAHNSEALKTQDTIVAGAGKRLFWPIAYQCSVDVGVAPDLPSGIPALRVEAVPQMAADAIPLVLQACCCGSVHTIVPVNSEPDGSDSVYLPVRLECTCGEKTHLNGSFWEPTAPTSVASMSDTTHDEWIRERWRAAEFYDEPDEV